MSQTRKRTKHVCVNLTPGEAADLDARAASAGVKKSAYARQCSLAIPEDMRRATVDFPALSAIYKELKVHHGGNLRQVAGHIAGMPQYAEACKAVSLASDSIASTAATAARLLADARSGNLAVPSREASPDSIAAKERTRHFCLMLNAGEVAELSARARRVGLSKAGYVRLASGVVGGEAVVAGAENLGKVRAQLEATGQSLNSVAHSFNAGQPVSPQSVIQCAQKEIQVANWCQDYFDKVIDRCTRWQ